MFLCFSLNAHILLYVRLFSIIFPQAQPGSNITFFLVKYVFKIIPIISCNAYQSNTFMSSLYFVCKKNLDKNQICPHIIPSLYFNKKQTK